MDIVLRIAYLAFDGANQKIFDDYRQSLNAQFKGVRFIIDEKNPQVICFISGGSERQAVSLMRGNRHYILLANYENNALAAASEVKAWGDIQGIGSTIICREQNGVERFLDNYARAYSGIKSLSGKKLGLLGKESNWLIASGVNYYMLSKLFGIEVVQIPWDSVNEEVDQVVDPDFMEVFGGYGEEKMKAPARFHSFLWDVIAEHKLDAITVECFPMVNNQNVTACLSLALLNSNNFVAGCEGDMVSAVGMMILQSVTGRTPWMANLTSFSEHGVCFSHCTIPLNMIAEFDVVTHFETDKGTAIKGVYHEGEATVCRFDRTFRKLFVASGLVVKRNHQPMACRTQVEIKLPDEAIACLKNSPLGNHHLILQGDQKGALRALSLIMDMEIIN